MKLVPIGERVVLKPVEGKEKTEKGIYLPKSEDKKEGEVLAVGTFKDGKPLPLKVGDRVFYGGYSSEEFEEGGEKYIVIEFKDILAKIEE
ncbi:co-chaperone GroES [Candidatus Pacearchaeota archaeon]|nr:MAG: co-chaperone GroES [Candidatus Pacearchaeota archaeon]